MIVYSFGQHILILIHFHDPSSAVTIKKPKILGIEALLSMFLLDTRDLGLIARAILGTL
jgi:hypothetical protein